VADPRLTPPETGVSAEVSAEPSAEVSAEPPAEAPTAGPLAPGAPSSPATGALSPPTGAPSDGADLARRRFFRQFAGELVHTAATVVGVAGALQRSSAEAAGVLLGGGTDGSRSLTTIFSDTAAASGIGGSASVVVSEGARGFRTAFRWDDDKIFLIDQRRLPHELVEMTCETASEVAWAIGEMVIRGAPAMGQAAAIGLALTAERMVGSTPYVRRATINGSATALISARATAINVKWAVDRCVAAMVAVDDLNEDGAVVAAAIRREAEAIVAEAAEDHEHLAMLGLAELPIPDGRPLELLTHCNTGPLACGQFGTALGVVQVAAHLGRGVHVWVDETRPYLQGARLTAWELGQAGVPHTLIADSAAGYVLSSQTVDAVLVGADRIAANGDTANKIGTYPIAVLARRHGVPFYVCAPISSIDLTTADGGSIAIEKRAGDEITSVRGTAIAPLGTTAFNPAFDVTPADLITAIVTEEGVLQAPFGPALQAAVERRAARRLMVGR
jgi:methylthioribose-1-phosphate isomerase